MQYYEQFSGETLKPLILKDYSIMRNLKNIHRLVDNFVFFSLTCCILSLFAIWGYIVKIKIWVFSLFSPARKWLVIC